MENLVWKMFSKEKTDSYKEECYRAEYGGGHLVKIIDWDCMGDEVIHQSKKIILTYIPNYISTGK